MISSGDHYDRFTRFLFSSRTEPLSATDFFREFEEMSDELYRLFEEFQDMPSVTPNRLSRKYEKVHGKYATATDVYVHLSSLEVGSRAEPSLNQFRKVGQEAKSRTNGRNGRINRPKSFVKREPLFDIIKSANDVKIIAELPAVNKEDISLLTIAKKV